MSIDLEPRLLQEVKRILEAHVPECEVWAFGSRVEANAKQFSDLDLAVVASEALTTRRLALLANAFEESDLPIKVDVVDWRSASPALRQHIAACHETVFRATEPPRLDSTRSG